MRVAPLKGDCVICQAPDPTRQAINAAIWPGEAMIRSATYRAAAVDVARTSGVPGFAKLNVKTVTRHVEHIEASWRELPPNGQVQGVEAPVKGDFISLVDQSGRLGAKVMNALEKLIDENPAVVATLMTKEAISIAKLGLTAATAGENARLKSRQQKIDVMAIFAQGSGHLPPVPPGAIDDEDDVPLDVLRAALDGERRQLAERNE